MRLESLLAKDLVTVKVTHPSGMGCRMMVERHILWSAFAGKRAHTDMICGLFQQTCMEPDQYGRAPGIVMFGNLQISTTHA